MTRRFSFSGVWAIALLLGFVYLLLAIFQPLVCYDEGLIIHGAERVMQGQVPYRDFATYYAPAQFYSLAGLFRLFGCSILVERTGDMLVRFGMCVLVLLIGRRLVPKKAALLAPLISLLLLAWCGNYGYPVIPAMFFSFLSILLMLRFISEPSTPLLLLAGGATGAAALYRQDIGAFTFFSMGFTVMVYPLLDARFKAADKDSVRQSLRVLFRYGIGAGSILVPIVCYFLATVPFVDLQMDFVGFYRVLARFRHLPLPPLVPSSSYLLSSWALGDIWFLFYGPLAVYLVSMMGLLRSAWKAREQEFGDRQRGRLILTVLGLLLYLPAMSRADMSHCLAVTLPASIIIVLLLEDRPRRKGRASNLDPLAWGLVVLAAPYLIFPVVRWSGHLYTCAPWRATSSLRRARYFHLEPDMEAAARFVHDAVPEGQEIFVGNSQHHQVFVSNVLFYFLAERGAGTRYYDFIPGIITTAPVQQQVISDLEKNRVEYVGRSTSAGLSSDGNEVLPDSGVTLLDNFLQEHYGSVRKFGDYTIFRKMHGGDTDGRGHEGCPNCPEVGF